MFSMCSELTPRAPIPDTRIPQLMQPCSGSISKLSPNYVHWLYQGTQPDVNFGQLEETSPKQFRRKDAFSLQGWVIKVLCQLGVLSKIKYSNKIFILQACGKISGTKKKLLAHRKVQEWKSSPTCHDM